MAANDSVRVRVTDLVTKLLEYVRDGKRDANDVARVLQVVKDDPNFIHQLFPEETGRPQVPARNRRARHLLDQWYDIYVREFGMKLDLEEFRAIKIPPRRSEFDRLIVVLKGLTLGQIVQVLQKHMKIDIRAGHLNSITSVRNTSQTYAIWVRDYQEADKEFENMSAEYLIGKQIKGITLEEYFLFELKYYLELGLHLDIKNVTRCDGSRNSNGNVLIASWDPDDGEVIVYWYDPLDAGSGVRSRQVIA
ncbi:MAG: hypothetical protein Q8P76_04010 [bacterium]|nr:hypothetical protein [bacterium]